MTTVVATNERVYTDTRACIGESPVDNTRKIFVNDQIVFVGAGSFNRITMFWEELIKNPKRPPKMDMGDSTVCWYIREDKRWYTDGDGIAEVCTCSPIVMGSGGVYVHYGLNIGLSVQEAFEIALKYDTCTGGKLEKFNLTTWEFE